MSVYLGNKRQTERGFALLFVLFLVALVVVGGSVALLNQLTEGRRQKEAETIWRGGQYQRAIGLYYRKFGRFPTRVDDLVKEQNGVRFLREPYMNPMNKEDGSWRFVYVTPAGQLIGSVRYTSLQQMAFLDKQRQMGIATGTAAGATPTAGEAGAAGPDSNAPSAQPSAPPPVATSGGANVVPGNLPTPPEPSALAGQNAQQQPNAPASGIGGSQGQQPVQPFFSQGLQPQTGTNPGIGVSESSDSSGSVIGGFIIGVAGKSDKRSIKVYKGGATYKQWEFIFNPLEQVQTIGTVSNGPRTPAGQQLGNGVPQPPQPQPPQIPQQ